MKTADHLGDAPAAQTSRAFFKTNKRPVPDPYLAMWGVGEVTNVVTGRTMVLYKGFWIVVDTYVCMYIYTVYQIYDIIHVYKICIYIYIYIYICI